MGERKVDPPRPRQIQLPFAIDGNIGLGDVLKQMTSAIGIKPCGGCQKRAEWLNQQIQFRGKCRHCD